MDCGSGRLCLSFLLGLHLLTAAFATADEGMWTFDNPPRTQLKERHGFEPSQEWLDHLRLSSVKVGTGGSGSFVSPNGLLLTNHHVGRGQIQKLSTKENDLMEKGFLARTHAEELKCPDLEVRVLISMENVTTRIAGAVKSGMTANEALDTRKKMIARIVRESTESTGLQSDVVSICQGSEYWLYRYRKYTDVRLVMAPEQQIAFYGGDPDNFTFPRHDLDMTLFRVYENGGPLKTDHYFRWNRKGAQDGELVFVPGHPGSTSRMQTMAQTVYQRDVLYPERLRSYARRISLFKRYADRGPEEARRAASTIFGLENSQKVAKGEYEGLLDRALMERKEAQERELRGLVNANPAWKQAYGWAWDSIAAAIEREKTILRAKNARTVRGSLYNFAGTLVEYAHQMRKPDDVRLPAYQSARLSSTKYRLFSPAPIYADMEEAELADGLAESLEILGPEDPFVKAVLEGKEPQAVAHRLVAETRLADPQLRRRLFESGEDSIESSSDPMIVLARKLSPMLEELRLWYEENVDATMTAAREAIGRARFSAYGRALAPDATSTLRLSYGTVKGYPLNGTVAPSKTTLYGLFDRAHSFDMKKPFNLPEQYLKREEALDLTTPLNFVCTADIIGGNSGSPVVNRAGELVGLIFDGNIESLPGRFLYTDERARAVSVHPAAMLECLRKVYDAGVLADELEGESVGPGH